MSETIDNKVVQMSFEAPKFEENVKSTVSWLDKLTSSLNFKGADRSLNELEKSINSVSLDGIGRSVDNISNKFTGLGVVGFTILQDLTRSAIASAKALAKSLTIDPITTGLEEYEVKMNSIRTIFANTKDKGTSLDDVNQALQRLNDYSDNTVYNFAQMTDMVGKFAAKTGELDSSVSIVQGLANLAAMSGIDNTKLQGALYQVSQMAETVKSLDWMSMDTAGLSTVKFKDDLIEMAKAMGTVDTETLAELESGMVSFRDTLAKGWLTKDVFSAVTAMYAVDEEMTKAAGEVTTFTKLLIVMREAVQSGWSVSWENIIGDKDQATKTFGAVRDAFAALIKPSTDARNRVLELWNALGGREATIKAFANLFSTINDVMSTIDTAFKNVFGTINARGLINFSIILEHLTSKFKMGDKATENLEKTFTGLFSVLGIGADIVEVIALALFGMGGALEGLDILSVTANIGDFLTNLRATLNESGALTITLKVLTFIFTVLFNAIKLVGTIIGGVFLGIGKILSSIFSGFDDLSKFSISDFLTKLNDKLGTLDGIADKVYNGFLKLKVGFKAFGDSLKNSFPGRLISFIGDFFDNLREGGFNIPELNGLKTALGVGGLAGVILVLTKLGKALFNMFTKNTIKGKFLDILGGFADILEAYQATIKSDIIIKIAVAIGILAGSLFLLSMTKPEKLVYSVAALGTIMLILVGIIDRVNDIAGNGNIGKIVTLLMSISLSASLMAGAMKKLDGLDSNQILASGLAMVTLMVGLAGAMVMLTKYSTPMDGMISMGLALVGMAVAVRIIAGAVKSLKNLNQDETIRGVAAITGILLALSMFMAAANSIGGSSVGLKLGIGMVGLSVGVLRLAEAVEVFGKMPVEVIKQGGIAVGVLLGVLGGFAFLAKGNTSMLTTGAGILVISYALTQFTEAIRSLSTLTPDELISGISVMSGLLLIIVGVVRLLNGLSVVGLSVGMGLMAGALLLFGVAIKSFEHVSWEVIGAALGSFAIALALLVGTALLVSSTGVIAPIYLLVGAIYLLGIATGVAGAGMGVMALGLASLATVGLAGAAGIAAVFVATAVGLKVLGAGLAAGLAEFTFKLSLLIPEIRNAIVNILISMSDAIIEASPKIYETMGVLFLGLIQSLDKYAPDIADSFYSLISKMLEVGKKRVPEVGQMATDYIVVFLNTLGHNQPKLYNAGYELVTNLINGLANAISNNRLPMIEAIDNLINTMLETMIIVFVSGIANFAEKGGIIVTAFVDAFEENFPEVTTAVHDLEDLIINTISALPDKFVDMGKDIVLGLVEGITGLGDKVYNAAADLATAALDGTAEKAEIKSPSVKFRTMGNYMGDGLILGFLDKIPEVETVAGWVTDKLMDAMTLEYDQKKQGQTWVDYYAKQAEATVEARNQKPIPYDPFASLGSYAGSSTKKTAAQIAEEEAQAAYNHSVAWIDQEKYYKRLALEDELAAWQRVQARYLEGSELRKKADREVYRVKMELIDKEFDHSLDWIDERLYYNELSLTEELAAWERVQARYDEGTDKRKKADREVYRVKKELVAEQTRIDKEYYDQSKAINDQLTRDIDDLNDRYDQSLQARTDSLYNAYSLFDKVTNNDPVSGHMLINNLKDQVDQFEDWQDALSELSGKGLDSRMIQELTDMGPRSAAEIKALNSLSGPLLDHYVNLWRKKYKEANQQATIELTEMRNQTDKEISLLTTNSETQLEELRKVWAEEMGKLSNVVIEELVVLNENWSSELNTLSTETEQTFTDLNATISDTVKGFDWIDLGKSIVQGLIEGIELETDNLKKAVGVMANQVLLVSNETLDVNSPSRKMIQTGRFAVQGFVLGILGSMVDVTKASMTIGKTTIDILKDGLSNLSEEGVDINPTITPVLDMSDVKRVLSSAFTDKQLLNLSESELKAISVAKAMSPKELSSSGDTYNETNQNESKLLINNYYTVRDDNDIRKINRDLDSTLSRYAHAKGVQV